MQRQQTPSPARQQGAHAAAGLAAAMAAPCSDAEVRRALSTVAVKCSDATLLGRLAAAAAQHGLTAKAIAARYSTFTINR